MMWWQNALFLLIGLSGGLLVAGGLFAFLTMVLHFKFFVECQVQKKS